MPQRIRSGPVNRAMATRSTCRLVRHRSQSATTSQPRRTICPIFHASIGLGGVRITSGRLRPMSEPQAYGLRRDRSVAEADVGGVANPRGSGSADASETIGRPLRRPLPPGPEQRARIHQPPMAAPRRQALDHHAPTATGFKLLRPAPRPLLTHDPLLTADRPAARSTPHQPRGKGEMFAKCSYLWRRPTQVLVLRCCAAKLRLHSQRTFE